MFDSGVISGALLKGALPKVAEAIIKKVNSQLNPTELEKALRDGITAAMKQYDSYFYQESVISFMRMQ